MNRRATSPSIKSTGQDATTFTDNLPSSLPAPSNGSYELHYRITAVNAAGESAPDQWWISLPSIVGSVNRTVVRHYSFPVGRFTDCYWLFQEALFDQFGNPMPNTSGSERIHLVNAYKLRSPVASLKLGTFLTDQFGHFVDESGEQFWGVSGGFIDFSQDIVVGDRAATFNTYEGENGSIAGSGMRAIFREDSP